MATFFGHTNCPLSFVVIAVIFWELRVEGGIRPSPPPVSQDPKKPGPDRVKGRL